MIKVAAYQYTPANNIQARKAQINDILGKAAAKQIDFLCLPEGALTGYYAQEKLARKNFLSVEEEDFQEWLGVFRNSAATVIVGFNEQDGDQIFDSAAIIENGTLLGVQRKHYLYHNYFASGTSFSPFSSKGITFGVVICLDTNYFEPARILTLQGVTILFSPMCNKVSLDHAYAKRPPYYSQFVARAHENRCWLISADWIWPNDGASICPGHSVIYDPDGREIARSQEGEEQFVVTEIPLDHLFHEKGRRVQGSQKLAPTIIPKGETTGDDLQVVLKTNRLILRLPNETDRLKFKAFDERNMQHLSPWRSTSGELNKDHETQLTQWEQEFKEGKSIRFLLFLKDNLEGEIIGFCNFSQIFRGPFQACYLGYHIDKNFEGKGLMSEAVAKAIEYMFEQQKLHRIMANYMPSNKKSGCLLQKLGFVVEGHAKKYLLINGKWEDHILTSITNENWLP